MVEVKPNTLLFQQIKVEDFLFFSDLYLLLSLSVFAFHIVSRGHLVIFLYYILAFNRRNSLKNITDRLIYKENDCWVRPYFLSVLGRENTIIFFYG